MTATSESIDASVRSAVLATYAVFIASGIAFASWASRIPQVRDGLHLDPSELGLVLLAIAAGSVIALPLSGVIVGHFGSRWTVRTTALLAAVSMVVVVLGYLVGVVPVVIGLFLFGFGIVLST
jgi:fucose permease